MATEPANIMREVHVTSIPDICLVLPSGELKILANVAVLRNASPVFRAMLGPDYLEGQAIKNTESTPEIDLPEDDARAMLLLMQILHMRYGELRDAMTHPEFLVNSIRDTAILADKYDVCQAVSAVFYLLARLDKGPKMTDMEDVWSILSASYIVGNRNAFKVSSARLIMQCDVAYFDFAFKFSPAVSGRPGEVPRQADMSICMLLEEKRGRIRAKVHDMTRNDILRFSNWAEDSLEEYMPCVTYSSSLNTTRRWLRDTHDQMSSDIPEHFHSTGGTDIIDGIMQMLDKSEKPGLCFDCVGHAAEAHDCTRAA